MDRELMLTVMIEYQRLLIAQKVFRPTVPPERAADALLVAYDLAQGKGGVSAVASEVRRVFELATRSRLGGPR
jgi:hypothetical protein